MKRAAPSLDPQTPLAKTAAKIIALFLIAAILSVLLGDLFFLLSVKTALRRPKDEAAYFQSDYKISEVTWALEHRGESNPAFSYTSSDLTEDMLLKAIRPYCDWVNARYDKMDFKAARLYLFIQAADDVLDEISPSGKVRKKLDETFLNMKFWITEKGDDSACYYSENHQIAYFTLAYLIGRRYADKRFSNDGKTGSEKAEEARNRILTWLDLRGKYGFSEFYSHNYLPIDFGELSLLMLYGDRADTLLMEKAAAVLDILCLDYALSYSCGTIIGPQGRAYGRNNMNTAIEENNSDRIIDAIWNDSLSFGGKYDCGEHQADFFIKLVNATDENGLPLYEVPDVIQKIGESSETQVIKTSFGVNTEEYEKEGLLGQSDKQIMFQLGSGALTNPAVILNTLRFVSDHSLWSNDFLSTFKFCNLSLLRDLGLLPRLSSSFNIYTNGMSLDRANVYIYKTQDYKLSTLFDYKTGQSGAQQTTMALILPGGVTVYTTHPLTNRREYDAAPGYWAGFGVAPQSAQHENVSLLIHKIPSSVALSPYKMLSFTHTFLPEELLDEVIVKGNYAFARKGNVLFAIIGSSAFEYKAFDPAVSDAAPGVLKDESKRYELVQNGRYQATCYEVSTLQKEGSIGNFMARIESNAFSLSENKLSYRSNGKNYSLSYSGDFFVDSAKQNALFSRYDSPYVHADYLSNEISIDYQGQTYFINVERALRGETK